MMYITSSFAAALIASYWFGILTALIPAALCIVLYWPKNTYRMKAAVLLMSYMAGVVSYGISEADTDHLSKHYGDETVIICRVIQTEKREAVSFDGSTAYYLQLKANIVSIDGVDIKDREKILIRFYPTDGDQDLKEEKIALPGRVISAEGIPETPDGRRNPGCFDYSLYLSSIGIRTVFTTDQMDLQDSLHSTAIDNIKAEVYSALYMAREGFLEKLEVSAGKETAGLMRAIMFGEKTEIEEDTLDEFRKNGTAHVLAVSGLHIGIIYGFLSMLWRWKKGRLFFSLIVIFFLAYMVMASFSPSVVRAVIMVWLHVFANLTGRRYDMASAAFFTALVMLVSNPMHLFNVGFQMSFLAVLTLSLMMPLIKRFYSGIFLGSLAIQAGLVPYTVYMFNYVSIASVFVNVPIIFLTGIIVPAGMCCMATMMFQPAFDIISKILLGLCSIMERLNEMTGIDGVTVFDVTSPDVRILAVYYLSLLIFLSEDGRLMFLRKRKKTIVVLAAAVIMATMIFGAAAGNDFRDSDVVFVDVGQGDCIHFRAGRRGDYLVDGGGSISYDVGKKTLKPYLLKNGVSSVDGAFITHLHTDHYKGIAELCREGMVEKIYVYEGYMVREDEILEDTGLERNDIVYLYAGQTVKLEDGTSVEVLWPDRKSSREYTELAAGAEDENSLSLMMKITVKGRGIMATGDVDADCLDMLAEKYGNALDIDILKVAHHGSKYSDSENFTEAASPQYAVFQVGKNNFGHPDKGIVEKFCRQGIIIYRNDTDGAIAFEFKKGDEAVVRTVKENEGGWQQSFTRKRSMRS